MDRSRAPGASDERPRLAPALDIIMKQRTGVCLATGCEKLTDGLGDYLCRPHWKLAPADLRREVVCSLNAYRATRNVTNQHRFRSAWWALVSAINAPKPASFPELEDGGVTCG